MRCDHCGQVPIDIALRVAEGRQLTMRACCGLPQWFAGREPIGLAEVIHLVPRRRPRQRAAA